MKRSLIIFAVVVVVVGLVAIWVGVSQKDLQMPTNLNLTDVYQSIIDMQPKTKDDLVLVPETNIELINSYYTGLSDIELNQSLFYMPPITGFAEEICLVEVKNAEDVSNVEKIFQERIQKGINASMCDADAQIIWKSNAQVQIKGNYLCMIVLPDGYVIPKDIFNIENNDKAGIDYPQAYAKKINEIEQSNDSTEPKTYSLVYINNDNIPELIADNNGYKISAYTYKEGKVYTLFEDWPYGAMGNNGYEYIEKSNIIRNYNSDFAGLIKYVTYYMIDANSDIKSYYDKELYVYLFDDKNSNGIPDEGEYSKENLKEYKYFYGEEEITKQQYDNYLKQGDFKFLEGIKTATEIINELK